MDEEYSGDLLDSADDASSYVQQGFIANISHLFSELRNPSQSYPELSHDSAYFRTDGAQVSSDPCTSRELADQLLLTLRAMKAKHSLTHSVMSSIIVAMRMTYTGALIVNGHEPDSLPLSSKWSDIEQDDKFKLPLISSFVCPRSTCKCLRPMENIQKFCVDCGYIVTTTLGLPLETMSRIPLEIMLRLQLENSDFYSAVHDPPVPKTDSPLIG